MEAERYTFASDGRNVFPDYAFLAMMRQSRAGAALFAAFFLLFAVVGLVIVLNPDKFLDMWTRQRYGHPSVPVYPVGVISIVFGLVFAAPFAFMLFPPALTWGDYRVFRLFHRKVDDSARNDPMRERRRLLDDAFYKPPYVKLCPEAEISDGMLRWNPPERVPGGVSWAQAAVPDGGRWRFEAPLERFDRLCVGRGIASFDLLVTPSPAGWFGFDYSTPVYSVVLDVSGMGKAELTRFTDAMRRQMSKDAKILRA